MGATRAAYSFEGTEPSRFFEPPRTPTRRSRKYRNTIAVAQEWQRMLDMATALLGLIWHAS